MMKVANLRLQMCHIVTYIISKFKKKHILEKNRRNLWVTHKKVRRKNTNRMNAKKRHFRLIICVFPVMPVTTAIPLSRISTISYLASTITFPFNVITPQCLGICSKAQ